MAIYANLIKIGPVTPKITRAKTAPFGRDGKNWHIPPNFPASTLCKNLLNVGPVTLEFKKGDCGIFAAIQPQFDDRPSFGTLAFRN